MERGKRENYCQDKYPGVVISKAVECKGKPEWKSKHIDKEEDLNKKNDMVNKNSKKTSG